MTLRTQTSAHGLRAAKAWTVDLPENATCTAKTVAVEATSGADGNGDGDPVALALRQISHDIRHELGTIMLLASLLSGASDIGPESRLRAGQIQSEVQWLGELHRAYEAAVAAQPDQLTPTPLGRIRLDTLAGEVVAAMQMSTLTRITFSGTEAWARLDRLPYWRVLRNLIGNAVRAAGDGGRVEVRVTATGGRAVVLIEDDGPGLGGVPARLGSLGLGIAQNQATTYGGWLKISRRRLGGCRVHLSFPSADSDSPV